MSEPEIPEPYASHITNARGKHQLRPSDIGWVAEMGERLGAAEAALSEAREEPKGHRCRHGNRSAACDVCGDEAFDKLEKKYRWLEDDNQAAHLLIINLQQQVTQQAATIQQYKSAIEKDFGCAIHVSTSDPDRQYCQCGWAEYRPIHALASVQAEQPEENPS